MSKKRKMLLIGASVSIIGFVLVGYFSSPWVSAGIFAISFGGGISRKD